MEERSDDRQLELLAKIHNQLVDLKRVIIEVELAHPDTPPALQTLLKQIIGDDAHIDHGGHASAPAARQQKVIAPSDVNIQPGEGNN